MNQKIVDLEKVRRAEERIRRAIELDPGVTRRPVPISEILDGLHVLTVRDVSRLTGFSPSKVRRDIRAGRLRAWQAKPQNRYQIEPSDLASYLKNQFGIDEA